MGKGVRNGIPNGLKVLLDVEAWNYAYFHRGAKGFMVALADQRDKAIVNQNGFYIAPGTENLVSITSTKATVTNGAYDRFTPEERECYSDSEFEFM